MKRIDRLQVEQLARDYKNAPMYPDPRFPPSLYYRFLYLLAQATQPEVSVELGVCGGGGSLHLALGWPKGKVIGIDIENKYPDQVDHVKETCPNFVFWKTNSLDAAATGWWLNRWSCSDSKRWGRVGILFIDTVHTYRQTLAEQAAWSSRMHPNSIIVLDDLFREGMQEAWDVLPGRDKVRLDLLHDTGGFGVILL